jgi:hypothetical protein
MTEPRPIEGEAHVEAGDHRHRWDALGVIVASLVGLLALVVAGYTAYIQREQVRAQVWPYLIPGNNDLTQSLVVNNKGVGPAIVRGVQVWVDGKPQTDWDHVLTKLGLPPHHFTQTTINHGVLSPGEELQIIRFPDQDRWQRFRAAAADRMAIDICFCSTLGECWKSDNKNLIGSMSMRLLLQVRPVDRCPRLPPAATFNN